MKTLLLVLLVASLPCVGEAQTLVTINGSPAVRAPLGWWNPNALAGPARQDVVFGVGNGPRFVLIEAWREGNWRYVRGHVPYGVSKRLGPGVHRIGNQTIFVP